MYWAQRTTQGHAFDADDVEGIITKGGSASGNLLEIARRLLEGCWKATWRLLGGCCGAAGR